MTQLKMNNWLEYNTEENLDGLAVLFKYKSKKKIKINKYNSKGMIYKRKN